MKEMIILEEDLGILDYEEGIDYDVIEKHTDGCLLIKLKDVSI